MTNQITDLEHLYLKRKTEINTLHACTWLKHLYTLRLQCFFFYKWLQWVSCVFTEERLESGRSNPS